MNSNKTQHQDDFIHALHDDIPQDFADDLYKRLQALDDEETTTSQVSSAPRAWWTLAVASIMAVMLGGLLLVAGAFLLTPGLVTDALGLVKAFGRSVEEWMEGDVWDWDELQEKLELRERVWEESAGIR